MVLERAVCFPVPNAATLVTDLVQQDGEKHGKIINMMTVTVVLLV